LEDGNIGNFYAMYAVMKAAMTAQPTVVWTFGTHWWQNGTGEYDDWLVANQNPDGSWPAQWDSTRVLSTEWALLILEKVAPPPPFSVTISPSAVTMVLSCNSVTFTSTVTGGTPPYSYQWYLGSSPVAGATSASWKFTPTFAGIYYVYLIVTDSKGMVATSNTARVVVTQPVGGYSASYVLSPGNSSSTALIALYGALAAALGVGISLTKRKKKNLMTKSIRA
jgi:hypothetical protein